MASHEPVNIGIMRSVKFLCGLVLSAGILFSDSGAGLNAQTCCSGGVPLSGNIGFSGSSRGTWQFELGYDLNYLSTLKQEREIYEGDSRKRLTHSLLFKTGYSISGRFAVDALFTFVQQDRRVVYEETANLVQTRGIGDAVIIGKMVLSSFAEKGTEFQLGAGPKIPLGRSDLTDGRGITLNADLQPGSNSWDLITWGLLIRQFKERPTATYSARVVGRFNGTNPDYLGSQTYRFGHSFQVYLGAGDQFLVRNRVVASSLSFRFRYAMEDRVNGMVLDNTGGEWINLIPAVSWHIRTNTILQLVPEIPLFSRVEGIQLTPTFRFQVGLYHALGKNETNTENRYQL